MLLVGIVLKPGRHLLILFNYILPQITGTVWGSSGTSELTGGQDFTSVKVTEVPDKRHVSELEWQLTQHKAEAARWLLGKGTVSTSFLLSLSVFLLKNNSSIIGNS